MADETNGTETPTTDDLMREVTGLCDDAKVAAFIHCVVDLAKANDMNLLELSCALRPLLAATLAELAKKSSALASSDSLAALRDAGLAGGNAGAAGDGPALTLMD